MRFPITPFPAGWFRAASSLELPRGDVRPLRFCGKDLVLLRTADGVARAFDAHCPHLGANLGVGGRLVHGTLECPLHGWRYDSGGSCVAIPGGARIPAGAKLRPWPVCERNGVVLVHNHPAGEAPAWDVPELPESSSPDWTTPREGKRWIIRSHTQEFEENGMDIAHFPFLHRQQTAEIRSDGLEARGPLLVHRTFQRYAIFGLARLWVREVLGPLEITLIGPGMAVNRASVKAGIELHYAFVFYFTPLDVERIEMTCRLSMKRLGNPLFEWLLLRKAIREGARTIDQDVPIWENKRYRSQPLLCETDGPIMQYRSWVRQFYAPREAPRPGDTIGTAISGAFGESATTLGAEAMNHGTGDPRSERSGSPPAATPLTAPPAA
ncbi:MAG: aromatic ring-hydroxylating dioxygenase subunit alpha [Acidobacteriota bacterium]